MKTIAYLDNAATTFPKPEEVYVAMDAFYRRCGVNPGRSNSDLAFEADELIAATRRKLHEFFGNPHPDPGRIVFTANATEALNTAIQGVCKAGDHVVSTRLEHNSVLRPLWEMHAAGLTTFDLVPFDGHGFVDPAGIAEAIGPQTRLVILNHGSNVLGTLQDAAAVGAICRERGVLFLLDVSQTAGVVPIDMASMKIDMVAFAGHKSLLGPMGTGGLAIGTDVEVEPTRWGGTGVRSAERAHLRDYPYRLEAGTPNLHGIAGLKAGLDWILKRSLASIRNHEMQLYSRLLAKLEGIEGVHCHCAGADERHVAVLSLTIEGMQSDEIGTRLDVDHGIQVRAGLQCAPLVHQDLGTVSARGTVRVGIGPYNDMEDIDRILAGIGDCAAIAARRR